jgi:hypothetical protein
MKILGYEINKNKPILESNAAFVGKATTSTSTSWDDDSSFNRVERYKKYRLAYEKVPLVTAIIDVQANQTVQDFFFEGPDATEWEKKAEQLNLMSFFNNVTKNMLIFGNAYVEIEREGEEITNLKLINPITMEVYRKDTGEITGYGQIISGKYAVLWGSTNDARQNAKFQKKIGSFEDIAHFKFNALCSDKYGISVIETMLQSIDTKQKMEGDLNKVISKYVAPLIIAKVGNDQFPASQEIVDNIAASLRDLEAESELTVSHLVDVQVLGFDAKGMDIKTPLTHIEQQIITGGQVPPVLLGYPGGADKSAEISLRAFTRRIKFIQRTVKAEVEEKILNKGKEGEGGTKLIWSRTEEKEWLMDVDILRGLVTDGILTPQKANDLLPPKYRILLPPTEVLNGQQVDPSGQQTPRKSQMVDKKVTDNPNDPTKSTTIPNAHGQRVKKSDRE